ncbi:MAG: OmpA family protein [Flavipsychrobacter sp.]|jgi:chemotaxis protein MotB|nr:OmpA family protein [Flavipsychrobacter sp.]
MCKSLILQAFKMFVNLFIQTPQLLMKRLFTTIALVCIGAALLPSCIVSKKKYLAATQRADKEHADNLELQKRLAQQTELNKWLNNAKKDLITKVGVLRDSIEALESNIATLEGKVSDLNNKIATLGSENQSTAKELSNTKEKIAEQRRRLEQLQALIDRQQKATEALRKKIADALVGFNSSELTVTMKNGKVYISMQESLLFPSGSAEVNPKGKEALSKVATVLNTSKDIFVDIEGHTDSLPIHTVKYADNWALSTARATSIAHVLIDEYKVVPARLIASGRSEYDPVATNSTPEGRAKNRRTEIILEPKLDELMELMNKKPGEE